MERIQERTIAILPAGVFGSALAVPLAENGNQVILYNRSEEDTHSFQKTHRQTKLPEAEYGDNVSATSDLAHAVKKADMLILAPPTRAVADFYQTIMSFLSGDEEVLSVLKGLSGTKLVSQVLEEIDPSVSKRLTVLSGPNFAAEIATHIKMTTVVASDNDSATLWQKTLNTPTFEVLTSADVTGVQLGGALKNVIAFGYGMGKGAKLDEKVLSALKQRGFAEMVAIGLAMGAKRETFDGPSGRGDLDLTCTDGSRNYRAGFALGREKQLEYVFHTHKTIEGAHTAEGAVALADQYGVSVPLMQTVFEVTTEKISVDQGILQLETLAKEGID